MNLSREEFLFLLRLAFETGILSRDDALEAAVTLDKLTTETQALIESPGDGSDLMAQAYAAMARALRHPENSAS